MRYLFLLGCLCLAGCSFDLLEGGIVSKKENQRLKIGSLAFDRLSDNALADYDHDLRKDEYFINEDGMIIGIRLEKSF